MSSSNFLHKKNQCMNRGDKRREMNTIKGISREVKPKKENNNIRRCKKKRNQKI